MTSLRRPHAQRSSPPHRPQLRFYMIANGAPHETTARLISALADRFREQGHLPEVQLRALPGGVLPKIWELLRSKHLRLAPLRRTDVLVVHSPLALCLPSLVAARLLRCTVLSFVWDLHPESNRVAGSIRNPVLLWLFWLLERLGLTLSTQLLVSTDDYRPPLGRFGRKVTVLPLWPCDPVVDLPPPTGGRDRSTLRLAFAGQINSIRGVEAGISEVLDCWRGERVELHLFSGDPCPDALARRAFSDPRLRVVEHGYLNPADLQRRLAEVDLGWVCLDPTFHLPAFPSKILAYLCAGLPVLYTGPPQAALRRWLETTQLGLATTPGGGIGHVETADLKRGLSARRAAYFAEVSDRWGSVGRLL